MAGQAGTGTRPGAQLAVGHWGCQHHNMPAFRAADGTELAYHVHGEGVPLICLPGGPMRESAYLGDSVACPVTGS